jgi:hypothetical protein
LLHWRCHVLCATDAKQSSLSRSQDEHKFERILTTEVPGWVDLRCPSAFALVLSETSLSVKADLSDLAGLEHHHRRHLSHNCWEREWENERCCRLYRYMKRLQQLLQRKAARFLQKLCHVEIRKPCLRPRCKILRSCLRQLENCVP